MTSITKTLVAGLALALLAPFQGEAAQAQGFVQNHLYVADFEANRVFEFDEALALVDSWTHDTLDAPRDVEFGPNGHLYVVNERGNTVVEFDGPGSHVRTIQHTDLVRPINIGIDSRGNLYVSALAGDLSTHHVLKFNDTGAFLASTASVNGEFLIPGGIGVNCFDEVVVGNGRRGSPHADRLFVLDTNLEHLRTIRHADLDGSNEIVFRQDGHLFVTSAILPTQPVLEFDASEKFVRRILDVGPGGKSSLAVDQDQNLYVGNTTLDQIDVFDIDGEPAGVLTDPPLQNSHLAFFPRMVCAPINLRSPRSQRLGIAPSSALGKPSRSKVSPRTKRTGRCRQPV
jgi:DNA-binding beta-propeller fold protein YncE